MTKLLLVLILSSGLLMAAAPARPDDSRYHEALAQYEVGHYQEAFAAFARLADEGHCEAARIARQMVRHGTKLYPTFFQVEPERLARWERATDCPLPRDVAAR